MPHEPSKPKEDYSKQMFKVVEPGKGRGMTMREQKIEEPKPVVVGMTYYSISIVFAVLIS